MSQPVHQHLRYLVTRLFVRVEGVLIPWEPGNLW
jgi:hypothetical protein